MKPNLYMIHTILSSMEKVLINNPEAEVMPEGAVCPGYDIEVLKPIAVLRYLYGVKTQWSCQGNHKNETGRAYLMLEPDESFPDSLVKIWQENDLFLDFVDDVINQNGKMHITGKYRQSLKPVSDIRWGLKKSTILKDHQEHNDQIKHYPKLSIEEKRELNQTFIKVLKNWATEELNQIKDEFTLFKQTLPKKHIKNDIAS